MDAGKNKISTLFFLPLTKRRLDKQKSGRELAHLKKIATDLSLQNRDENCCSIFCSRIPGSEVTLFPQTKGLQRSR